MVSSTGKNKIKLKRTRQMHQNGGSVVLTVPPEYFELMQFSEGDKVEITGEPGADELVITRIDKE